MIQPVHGIGAGPKGIYLGLGTSDAELSIHGSQIANSGGHGIYISGNEDTRLRVSESIIEDNGDDGIFMENAGGCLASPPHRSEALVANSRISGNTGDGIEMKGTTGICTPNSPSTARADVTTSTVAMNGGYGWNWSTSGVFTCGSGGNQLRGNTSGPESAGPACLGTTELISPP